MWLLVEIRLPTLLFYLELGIGKYAQPSSYYAMTAMLVKPSYYAHVTYVHAQRMPCHVVDN